MFLRRAWHHREQCALGDSHGQQGEPYRLQDVDPLCLHRLPQAGYVPRDIDDCWEATNEDDLRALLARCRDFLFSEKRCEHQNDICLSAALHNDQWSYVYSAAPRIHVVYCAKCRKRAPLQFPIGMSDYINEVMNR